MDVITTIPLALLAVIEFTYKICARIVWGSSTPAAKYRRVRFGKAGDLIYFTRLIDTNRLQEMHWNINHWTDNEVLAWRDSHVSTCNSVSVAGAIFASIGLTALQLPDMYTVHWSARALCVVSMLLGVLSVTVATSTQQAVAMLNNPTSIRLWLSRGHPHAYDLRIGPFYAITKSLVLHQHDQRRIDQEERLRFSLRKPEVVNWWHEVLTRLRENQVEKPTSLRGWLKLMRQCAKDQQNKLYIESRTTWRQRDKYHEYATFEGMPLESSISILKVVNMPRHLLDMAVTVFIIGFGLYLLFSWAENMGDEPISHRNVFICFTIVVGTFVLYTAYIMSCIIDNEQKKENEFDLSSLGSKHRPEALADLERDLKDLQKRMKTLDEQHAILEKQINRKKAVTPSNVAVEEVIDSSNRSGSDNSAGHDTHEETIAC